MAHRHLILAYALTWVLQLGYAGVLAFKWSSVRRGPRSPFDRAA